MCSAREASLRAWSRSCCTRDTPFPSRTEGRGRGATRPLVVIELVHGALGATCGALLKCRPPTVAAAFISHLVLDAINHDEPLDENQRLRLDVVALDSLLLGAALVLLARRRGITSAESLGAIVGCLPDAEHFLHRLRRTRSGWAVHGPFPHAEWPSRGISVWWQFAIGVAAWLPLLGSSTDQRCRT